MFGTPLQHHDTVDSTNNLALNWPNAPHGAAVTADQQTAGRGRLGRQWVSPPGTGLYLSVILRPPAGTDLAKIALVAALAAAAAIRQSTNLPAVCKWPNDILIADPGGTYFKVGGILCETRTDESGPRIVVGIGLNVNQDREHLPDRPQFPASSLAILSGKTWDVAALRTAVLTALGEKTDQFFSGAWPDLLRELNTLCAGLGEVVQVTAPNETLLGVAQEIDADGFLVIRTADGPRRVVAGDVSYL